MLIIFFIVLCAIGVRITEAQQESVKKAIVIGASTGMGRALCKMLAADGYIVGMASRRITLLQELQQEIPEQTIVYKWMFLDQMKQ